MRQALNENPRVQLAVFGIAAVVFAIVLFTMVLGGGEAESTSTDVATDPTAGIPAEAIDAAAASPEAASPVDPIAPATPVEPGTARGVPSTPVDPSTGGGNAGGADGLLPTRGLPKDVLVAYARNKAIALLVIDPKGLADRRLEQFVRPLKGRDDAEVFVVKTRDIAKYSRITQGVSVDRAPALVVVTPRRLSEDLPTATVSYGFRSPKSAAQALDDVLYDGKPVSSFP